MANKKQNKVNNIVQGAEVAAVAAGIGAIVGGAVVAMADPNIKSQVDAKKEEAMETVEKAKKKIAKNIK